MIPLFFVETAIQQFARFLTHRKPLTLRQGNGPYFLARS